MDEDPFVTSSSQPPKIIRPIPRRNFSTFTDSSDSPTHAFAPTTPPSAYESQRRSSDFLSQLNARLLRTYNARDAAANEYGATEGNGQLSARNKSFMNLTKSTLFGIYDDEGVSTSEQSVAETPWGTGAETPAPRLPDGGRWIKGLENLDEGIVMESRLRKGSADDRATSPAFKQQTKPRRKGVWKYTIIMAKLTALFAFGVVYGFIISHLHDTRELAAVRVEGVDGQSWAYMTSWGLAGVALGCSLPYVELAWGDPPPETDSGKASETETSFGEQWNDVVRSLGAFMGIAFAIRRLPWQSTLQLTLTLALVNPALWYILDRSKPGLSFSLIVTSLLTSFIFLSNPDVLPSPSLPATVNGTRTPTPALLQPGDELFAGVVSYETLAVVTWVGSVLFCSCVCFGSIGRRLAVWDGWTQR